MKDKHLFDSVSLFRYDNLNNSIPAEFVIQIVHDDTYIKFEVNYLQFWGIFDFLSYSDNFRIMGYDVSVIGNVSRYWWVYRLVSKDRMK